MNKILYILSLLLTLVLASCSSDPVVNTDDTQQAISFAGINAELTRATPTSLSEFAQTFKLYGAKKNDGAYQTVFDNYVVTYASNSAGTTSSNSSNWEYVSAVSNQTIKYWDYAATNYSFSAVAGTPATGDFTFADRKATYADVSLTSYNLTADKAFYFSQPCQVVKTDYANIVQLQFTPYLCKIRIGFYENMDGFSVQNLTFGTTNTANLIATSSYTDEGTCYLTYDYANNKLTTSITPTATSTTKDFGEVQYSSKSSASALVNDLLGTSSDNASFVKLDGAETEYVTMLPHDTNDTPISITCSYEAVQSNGTVTKIKNIPATVPAEYAQWKPGYEYTYMFKVSDSNITLVDVNQVAIKDWGTTDDKDHPVYNW